MLKLTKTLTFIFLLAITVFAQEKTFILADGGFAIDLPENISKSEEVNQSSSNFYIVGKVLYWNEGSPNYLVQYLKYRSTNLQGTQNAMTPKMKTEVYKAYLNLFIGKNVAEKPMFKETEYAYNGNAGKQWHFIYPNHQSIIRIFFVRKTLYVLGGKLSPNDNEETAKKSLDTFRILSKEEIIDLKVKEAEPKPLPQAPVANKLKSDAEDENLKGKVKYILEESQNLPNKKKLKEKEEFYNERGNLLREVSYISGYPFDINVWGYIDGNRVNNSNSVYFDSEDFDSDEANEPPRIVTTSALVEPGISKPKRDERYSQKYTHKYNENGQLTEETLFQNDGVLWMRYVYNFKNSTKETIVYDKNGKLNWRETDILDKDGNSIENIEFDNKGKIESKTTYTYELDSRGNWIVQKSFENVKIKGKKVLKPSSITYRTITYYD